MGGNYVFKAQPYFPPVEVVRSNAKDMAEGRVVSWRENPWKLLYNLKETCASLDHFLRVSRITAVGPCFLPSPFAHRRQEDGFTSQSPQLMAVHDLWCPACVWVPWWKGHIQRSLLVCPGSIKTLLPGWKQPSKPFKKRCGCCPLVLRNLGTRVNCGAQSTKLIWDCRNLEGHENDANSSNYMIIWIIWKTWYRYDDIYIYESMYIWKYILYNHMFPTRKYMYKTAYIYIYTHMWMRKTHHLSKGSLDEKLPIYERHPSKVK